MVDDRPDGPDETPGLLPVPQGNFLFVSYASADRTRVLPVVDALRGAGLELWIDQVGIAGGTAYGTEIAAAIRSSAAVVLMCSERSLASRNVRQEIMLAWRYDSPILPLLLEPTTFPDDVAYWLEGAQWIEILDRAPSTWLPEVGRALRRHGLEIAEPVELSRPASSDRPDLGGSAAGNLPARDGPLIGRERELRELRALLESGRWVTLTGPGGTGKTRLALEAAHRAGIQDGAWFVDLASVTDPTAILAEVASSLGVSEEAGRPLVDLLTEHLAGKRAILLVDNVEQVAQGADRLTELAARCPDLVVLATSRIPLKVDGEWVYPVGQLELPDLAALPPLPTLAQNPAVRLFVERAREARQDFVLTDGTARPVAEICHRLDGLPLAIELAAARVRLLTPAAILTRLGSRLALLTRGDAASGRQQTLRNTIRWSHDLLSASEQVAFRRLAVLVGGGTIEAAEAVIAAGDDAAPVLDDIAALVDSSLVRTEQGVDEETRVRMLETVREFAGEELASHGEGDRTRAAHAAYFSALALARQADIASPRPGPALTGLRAEDDNLRAALDWLGSHQDADDADAELRLAAALGRYWRRLGRFEEAANRLEAALRRRPDGDPVARAMALQVAGFVAAQRGDTSDAVAYHDAALALWRARGDRPREALELQALAEVAEYTGDYVRAQDLREQVLAIWVEQGDEAEIAVATQDLGMAAVFQGDYATAIARFERAIPTFRRRADARNLAISLTYLAGAEMLSGEGEAIRHSEESLALWRSLEDRYAVAYATVNHGRALQLAARLDEATPVFQTGLAECVEIGDKGGTSLALYGLGLIALARGDDEAAFVHLAESLRQAHAAGRHWHVAERLEALAMVWCQRHDPSRAARLLGGAARMREEGGFPMPPAMRTDHARTLAAVEAALGHQAMAAAMALGRRAPGDALVEEALDVPTRSLPPTATSLTA